MKQDKSNWNRTSYNLGLITILLGKVIELESKFAEYLGIKHGLGVANGSEVLVLLLGAIGMAVNYEAATVTNAGFYS